MDKDNDALMASLILVIFANLIIDVARGSFHMYMIRHERNNGSVSSSQGQEEARVLSMSFKSTMKTAAEEVSPFHQGNRRALSSEIYGGETSSQELSSITVTEETLSLRNKDDNDNDDDDMDLNTRPTVDLRAPSSAKHLSSRRVSSTGIELY